MEVGEGTKLGEGYVIDLAARFANTPQQSLSRRAEGSVLPAGVLFAGFALPPLQYPLQRIIHDPPVRVELRHDAIGGVRWRGGEVVRCRVRERGQTRLAHPWLR